MTPVLSNLVNATVLPRNKNGCAQDVAGVVSPILPRVCGAGPSAGDPTQFISEHNTDSVIELVCVAFFGSNAHDVEVVDSFCEYRVSQGLNIIEQEWLH